MALRTPVALFIFNRPAPTARVFAAVRAARPRRLIIVADGPRSRNADDARACEHAREVVASVDWDCEVTRIYSEVNLGCGQRVSSGIDAVFEVVEEAILLEDDCLPDPTFFSFCTSLLEYYRDDERVGMIGGTNYFRDSSRGESYFFTRYFPVWGWATWRRAWRDYDFAMSGWPYARDAAALDGLFASRGLAEFLAEMFDATHRGEVDTWDIQWAFTCLAQGRLCAIPKQNLVTNIGFEGTRAASENVGMPTQSMAESPLSHPAAFLADQHYERMLYENKLRIPRRQSLRHDALIRLSRLRRGLSNRVR